jgi:hypothetical protein
MSTLSNGLYRAVRRCTLVAACVAAVQSAGVQHAHALAFTYEPIAAPILSASFAADFAAFTAHRSVFGFEVNALKLSADGNDLELSDLLFGSTDAVSDTALVDQGTLGTGIVAVPIEPAFLPRLAGGAVGVTGVLTDTLDGLFAIDFLSLTLVTGTGTTIAFIDRNNGFGIGIPDGGTLPAPLPESIPFGATGTGFDEAISSISVQPVGEPGLGALLAAAFAALALLGGRRRGAPRVRTATASARA